MRAKGGFTLVELLVTGIIALLIGSGLFVLAAQTWLSEQTILNQNTAQSEAREAVNMVVNDVLQLEPGPSTQATGTLIQFMRPASGGIVRIQWSPYTKVLTRYSTVNISTIHNITSFQLTYEFREPSSDGNLDHWFRFSAPSMVPLPLPLRSKIVAVYVSATATVNGATSTMSGGVWIRNQLTNIPAPV